MILMDGKTSRTVHVADRASALAGNRDAGHRVRSGIAPRITFGSDPDPYFFLFLVGHEHPVGDLVDGASAPAANVIEGGGADGDAGCVGAGCFGFLHNGALKRP